MDKLQPVDRAAVLAMVSLGNLLIMVGMTQITAVTPSIARDLGVDANLGGWVVTGFLLFLGGWVLTAGRLGDLYGHGRLFTAGALLFTVATLGAGLAGDIWQLIAFRCLQGLGGAFMLGNGLAVLRATFSERVQGRAIGVVVTGSAVGGTLGLVLGTEVVASLGWRPLFMGLVPVAALTTWGSRRYLVERVSEPRQPDARLDIAGAILLFVGLCALSLSVSHLHSGPETFEAGWLYHTGMQVLALLAFLLFVRLERRAASPLVDLRHFGNMLFTTALGVNFMLHFAMLGSSFMMSFVVERGMGLAPSFNGYVQASVQLALIATSFLSGWAYDRTRSAVAQPLGMALLAGSFLFLAAFGPQLPYSAFLAVAGLLGCALGSVNTVNNTLIMSVVPSEHRGFAAGMIETSRQLGHTMSVPVASALMAIGNPEGLLTAERVSWSGFQLTWLLMSVLAAAAVLLSVARGGALQGRVPGPAPVRGAGR